MTPQNPASPPASGSAPCPETSLLEEGARYALLQRLAPVLQHQIMGSFQSMGMVNVMMERRLQSDSPNLDSMRQDCALLGSISDSTIKSVINLLTWVRPKSLASQRFDAGIDECARLLLNEFKLRGFDIDNQVENVGAEVSSRALRSVVSAVLVCLSDQSAVQATLALHARVLADRIELSIELQTPEDPQPRNSHAGGYRLLTWRDVELLAAAESVGLTHSHSSAQLAFALPPGK